MRQALRTAASLALTVALVTAAQAKSDHAQGHAKGKPSRAMAQLDNSGLDEDARGKIDVKHFPEVGKRTERSWLRIKVRHLDADATYSLWMDDPTTTDDATLIELVGLVFETGDTGNDNLRLDTKKGDALPFDATLATLGGMLFEIRDGAGAVVLSGAVPVLQ